MLTSMDSTDKPQIDQSKLATLQSMKVATRACADVFEMLDIDKPRGYPKWPKVDGGKSCIRATTTLFGLGTALAACVCSDADLCNGDEPQSAPDADPLDSVDHDAYTAACPYIGDVARCQSGVECAPACDQTKMCCVTESDTCQRGCSDPFYQRDTFDTYRCIKTTFTNDIMKSKYNKFMQDNQDVPLSKLPMHSDCAETPSNIIQCHTMGIEMFTHISFSAYDNSLGEMADHITRNHSLGMTPRDIGTIQQSARTCADVDMPEVQKSFLPKLPTDYKDCIDIQSGNLMGLEVKGRVCACSGASCNGVPMSESFNAPVNGAWGAWHDATHCCESTGAVKTVVRKRLCDNPPPANGGVACSLGGGEYGHSQMKEETCSCNPTHGGWSEWEPHKYKGTCCEEGGVTWMIRYCRNPEPKWGGSLCVKRNFTNRPVFYGTVQERAVECICSPMKEAKQKAFAAWNADPDSHAGANGIFSNFSIVLGMLIVAVKLMQNWMNV